MKVQDAIAGCSTGQIHGLSVQLLDRLLEKNYLVKIDHPLIKCSGLHNNPYLQPLAYKNLVAAVKERNIPLYINSCLRTVMQQYMLWSQKQNNWCGIRAAAIPGRSNHQSGMAIDTQDSVTWKPYLEKHHWKYIGDFDPMHFDFKGAGVNLGKLQIQEFQQLWNEYNPMSALKVDGIWGAVTQNAVARSPSQGFGNPKVFRRGDYNYDVGKIQFLLRQVLGLSSNDLIADCHFGATTEKAVREFQSKHGLTVDGVVGQQTLKMLKKVSSR